MKAIDVNVNLSDIFEGMEKSISNANELKAMLPVLLLHKALFEKSFAFVGSAIKKAEISTTAKKRYAGLAEKIAVAIAYGKLTVDTSGRVNRYLLEQPMPDITGKFPVIDKAVLNRLEQLATIYQVMGSFPVIRFTNALTEKDILARLEKLQQLAVKNGYSFTLPSLQKLENI